MGDQPSLFPESRWTDDWPPGSVYRDGSRVLHRVVRVLRSSPPTYTVHGMQAEVERFGDGHRHLAGLDTGWKRIEL